MRKVHFKQLAERARAEVWSDGGPKAGTPRNGPRQTLHLWSLLKKMLCFAYDSGLITFNSRVEGLTPPSAPRA